MTKRIIKFGIPAALLILFVVLTVVLCCSTVFHGTYKGENSVFMGHKYEVVFDGNKVTYTLFEGEQSYIYTGTYKNDNGNIVLTLSAPDYREVQLERKNVFTLTQSGRSSVGGSNAAIQLTLTCDSAIWLQIFFSLGILSSTIFFIVQIVKQRITKNKNKT